MVSCVGSWELEFKQESESDLLLGLVVRDLLHGASYDLRPSDGDGVFAFDIVAADEIDDDAYRLTVDVGIEGPDEPETAQDLAMRLFDDIVDEAEGLVNAKVEIGHRAAVEIEFKQVEEDSERWDLVVPDWLAPDGAEVPFGFRPVDRETGDYWPTNEMLDGHGRIVVVPDGIRLILFGIPAPDESGTELPVS